MNIEKEFSGNQTLLLLVSSENYNKMMIDVVKKLSKKHSVAYVTLNKTYDSLNETFKKKGISLDNIVFIDAISKTFKKTPGQTKACYFCLSPGTLTEISLVISKFMKHNFDYIVFDSLNNMLIYQKKAPVSKFVSSLVNKIKISNSKAVFYALSEKSNDPLIKQSGMFVDKVVKY